MKTLCKQKDPKVSKNPKYVCGKCGREAKKKERLCKPKKLDD